jgi:hypothetical protein
MISRHVIRSLEKLVDALPEPQGPEYELAMLSDDALVKRGEHLAKRLRRELRTAGTPEERERLQAQLGEMQPLLKALKAQRVRRERQRLEVEEYNRALLCTCMNDDPPRVSRNVDPTDSKSVVPKQHRKVAAAKPK